MKEIETNLKCRKTNENSEGESKTVDDTVRSNDNENEENLRRDKI